MDPAELSLELGRKWLAAARDRDPENYVRKAWKLYSESADEVVGAALLAELSAALSVEALDLRAASARARSVPVEDLLRSGMMALQLALEELRHEEWDYVEERAQAMALEAMTRRARRP
jgi:hypothetical protein